MTQNFEEGKKTELILDTLYDEWFIAAGGSSIIAVSVGVNALTEANVNEPRAAAIIGGLVLIAAGTGKKTWANLKERYEAYLKRSER